MVTHQVQKKYIFFILFVSTLLTACGGGVKPTNKKELLINALVSKNSEAIRANSQAIGAKPKAKTLVHLYQFAIENKPYRLVANSQTTLRDINQYSLPQQTLLKKLLLWAYAHPIYRQETGKQVRILQRTELLVAPSDIDFDKCLKQSKGCSTLRNQVSHLFDGVQLNAVLNTMAHSDPCINLSDENLAGESASRCLATRKGDLKINLLSAPIFLASEWEQALE